MGEFHPEKERPKGSTTEYSGKYWMVRAALVRPLNSLGPVAGTALLTAAGYRGSTSELVEPRDGSTATAVSALLWWTSAATPAVMSLCVSACCCHAWAQFTLHGARLEQVERFHRQNEDASLDDSFSE